MNAKELFDEGRLAESIEAALADVKKHPTDVGRRVFLCELLCFAGDLERADKQLDVVGTQEPDAMMGVALFRQLIRAEKSRREFFEQGRVPEFLDAPTESQRLALEASVLLREDDAAGAAALAAESEEKRSAVAGVCNGERFDDFRDLDDLFGATFEVLTTNGKYYWIPVERVDSVEFRPAECVRDLMWRAAHMDVQDGPDGEVYLPALYAGSHEREDDQLKLGRGTDWVGDEESVVRGVGQRMFLAGDSDLAVMTLQTVEFEH